MQASTPSSDAVAVDAQNPWPGLEAFKEEDHAYFHGRSQEIDEIHRLVLRERLTVLFGVSGLGKTSLLQAGLFPVLRNESILPVRIRLNYSDGMPDFATQIKEAIAGEARAAHVDAPSLTGTLWEAFHREHADFWSTRNRVVTPLLVFDQFEEIFTRGHETPVRARDTEALLTELADLIEARVPADLKARVDVSPQEADAFSFQRHNYKILLSLREDFLADLESLSPRIPSVMHNRLRLCAMNGEQALAAVLRSGGHLIGDDVAKRVVRFVGAEDIRGRDGLANLNVEPALLSVFCRELNLSRVERGELRITAELLEGRQAEILTSFYERGVAGITPATRAFIEDSLVTAAGRRNSEPYDEALSKPGVTREDIAQLVNRRILRVEDRAGMSWLELTHDRLTGVVGASRNSRHQREAQDAAEAAEREARDNAARVREELRRKTRTLRMVRGLLVAASVGLIAAIAGAYFGFREQRRAQAAANSEREANHTAQEALADSQFREAMDLVDHDLAADSLPYLGSALRLSPDQPAIQAFTVSLLSRRNWPLPVHVTSSDAELEAVRLSPTGKVFATADRDGHAQLWDVETGLARGPELVHRGVVTSVGFSGDGARLVTASEDRTAVVWDVETARQVGGPFRHDEAVSWAGLTADGTRALTVSADGAATLWDVATGGQSARLYRDGEKITVARLSRDGRFAVTGMDDGTARIWDLGTVTAVATLVGHKRRIHDVSFSPDGQRVLTTSADNTARVWDARTGRPIGVPMKHGNVVWDGDFSPDGRLVATASDDGTVGIWSAATGLRAIDPIHHAAAVYTIEFSRDGRRIVTTSADYTARVWAVATGQPLTERLRHGDWLDAAFTADGTRVITASWDRTLRTWDVRPSAIAASPMRHAARVLSARFSRSGRYVLTTAADNTARVWDASTLVPVSPPLPHRGEVRLAEFSPDETRVMTVAHDGSATIWNSGNWTQGQPVGPLGSIGLSADWSRLLTAVPDHDIQLSDVRTGAAAGRPFHSDLAITSASLSPEARRVVIITEDAQARLIDPITGQPVGPPLTDRGGIGFARFSPDGKRLITASRENTTRVWEAETGRPVSGPLRHYDTVSSAEFSRDGSRVVTASRERAFIWNVDRGELVGQPLVHQDDVLSVSFSPNGRMVVTGSRDRTARIWDAETGEPESEPFRHDGPVRRAEFSADGTRVVTASDDGTARAWDVFSASSSEAALLARLTETVAGSVLGMRGPAVPMSDQVGQIERLRRETLGATDRGAAALVRWFLADRASRSNSWAAVANGSAASSGK
jgi:WD40 repeat protein